MALFVIAVLLISVGIPFFIARTIIRGLSLRGRARLAVVGAVGLLVIWVVVQQVVWRRAAFDSSAWGQVGAWSAHLTMALFSFLFTYLLLADLCGLCVQVVRASSQRHLRWWRRSSLSPQLIWLALFATGLSLAWGVWEARAVRLVVHDVFVDGLPPGLEGFSVVQITDLHVGGTVGRSFMERVANLVREADGDVLVLTGDVADGLPDNLRDTIEPLRLLPARHGRFYVTGNHEFYWDPLAWRAAMSELGFQVLENSHQVIKVGDEQVLVAGVPDDSAGRMGTVGVIASDPDEAGRTDEVVGLSLLLAHQPRVVAKIQQTQYDMVFLGHTHAGQFFPWTLAIHLAQPYVRGLYEVGNMRLYVSPGTGYWGPPVRLGARPEVTKIVFHSR